MRGYHRDRWEPEARAENQRVEAEIENGPVWPYERQNWLRWKELGQPRDMMIVLGDGSIFWSKGRQQGESPREGPVELWWRGALDG